MKRLITALCILIAAGACTGKKKIPDVSGTNISLTTERFEKDFFAIDTIRTEAALQALHTRYRGFAQDFLFNILGTSPDSAYKDVPAFIRSYRDMYKASVEKFSDFTVIEQEVKKGLQFAHHYFPSYKLPSRLVTFIGPINSYGNIITPDALAIGLQLYMGKDYPVYLSEQGQQLYPGFISRKFEPVYIPVNSMKNIIDDMYPYNSMGQPLIDQMVESGKRLYVLSQLLPETADTLVTGYSAKQLEACYNNEKNIWGFFVQNELLYNGDPAMTRDYLTDGPYTQAFGKESPGNIGQFIGMQIVVKWMEKKNFPSLDVLMKTPPRVLFEESKYKP
jgi:hypothetical protein